MTKAQLCNLALSEICERLYDDGGEQKSACDLAFDRAILEVLSACRWSFASKKAQIFSTDDRFPLPADCVRVEDVHARNFTMRDRNIITEGRTTLSISYISYDILKNKWGEWEIPDDQPLFIGAVASCLASKICMAVTGNSTLAQLKLQEYKKVTLENAMMINKIQDSSNDQHPLAEISRRGLFKRFRS